MKIGYVITNRASQVRLLSLIDETINRDIDTLIISAKHIENYTPVDYYINFLMSNNERNKMAFESGLIHNQLTTIFSNEKPDCIIIHGDRYEQLAVCNVSLYLNIPIIHIEGGEDSGGIDNTVRDILSVSAKMHFVSCMEAKEKVYKIIGTDKYIYDYGMPVIDLIVKMKQPKLRNNTIMCLYNPVIGENYDNFFDSLIEIQKLFNYKIVFINSNIDVGSNKILKKIHSIDKIEFLKNINYIEFYQMMNNCACMVGNSSSMIKEGSFLGTPCIYYGSRQENRIMLDNVIHVESTENKETITRRIVDQIDNGNYEKSNFFGYGRSSEMIIEQIKEIILT